MKKVFLILISGPSASGKTRAAELLKESLKPYQVKLFHMDSYYKKAEDRPVVKGLTDEEEYRDDNHPEAFDSDACYLEVLHHMKRDFDVLIIEGLFALSEERLRHLSDLNLYVECDPDERFRRRLNRHLGFGEHPDEITKRYVQAVLPRQKVLVEPLKWKADLILNGFSGMERGISMIGEWIRSALEKRGADGDLCRGSEAPMG